MMRSSERSRLQPYSKREIRRTPRSSVSSHSPKKKSISRERKHTSDRVRETWDGKRSRSKNRKYVSRKEKNRSRSSSAFSSRSSFKFSSRIKYRKSKSSAERRSVSRDSSKSWISKRRRSKSTGKRDKSKNSKWDVPVVTDTGPTLEGFSSFASGLILPTLQPPVEDRRGRRLYVGNLPPGISETAVVQFFNGALLAAAGVGYEVAAASCQFPVLKAEVYLPDHRYCFIEFRTIADASICLKLDGISFNGYQLKIGRPNDYTSTPKPQEKSTPEILASGGVVSVLAKLVPETKMYVTELPLRITEQELRKMCEPFGAVKSAALMKDLRTGQSMGSGVVEFENALSTEQAVKALDMQPIGNKIPRFSKGPLLPANSKLIEPIRDDDEYPKTSSIVTELPTSMTYKILSNAILGAQVKAARFEGAVPSKVVQLINTIFPEDLIKDEDFEAILADMKTEAAQYGTLIEVVIPRPSADLSYKPGVGKVFLHFSDTTAARRAQAELNGRRYEERRVICAAFFPLEKFSKGIYTLI